MGKSTLFNVLTKVGVPAENFPFCTIDPNFARVHVPDERYNWLCSQFKPKVVFVGGGPEASRMSHYVMTC